MWTFLRRQLNYFLIGFIISFIVYLFIRFDADAVLMGVVIGVVGGAVLSTALFYLQRRFPETQPPA